MINDDSRGNQINRRPLPKYSNDKNHSYSSNSNYSYGNGNFNGQHQGQHQRRRPDNAKRGSSGGSSDRIIKQNDLIIKLLKEIRDRLPAPPVQPEEQVAASDNEEMENAEQNTSENSSGDAVTVLEGQGEEEEEPNFNS